jgi:hypothetical protein
MSTNTVPNQQKAILTFNVFFREDTTTQSFLPSIVSKDPMNWDFFRSVLTGQKNCRLTIVDKSIETPFHCLLVALFCKQLENQLQTSFENMTMILSPLRKEHPGSINIANLPFDKTENRNDYLQECFSKVSGRKVKIATKRNPILCRDIKISSGDYILYLRFEGGVANGWQVDDAYVARLTPQELLSFASNNVKCKNIFTHGYSQNGVFINVDFLTKL